MSVFDNVKNFAVSKLASSISSSDTSLTVETGSGSKFPDPPFNCVIWDESNKEPHLDPDVEIVRVIEKNGDTFTIERGQEGTTGKAHSANERIELNLTAKMIEDIINKKGNKSITLVGLIGGI